MPCIRLLMSTLKLITGAFHKEDASTLLHLLSSDSWTWKCGHRCSASSSRYLSALTKHRVNCFASCDTIGEIEFFQVVTPCSVMAENTHSIDLWNDGILPQHCARRYNPEDLDLNLHCRESFKSRYKIFIGLSCDKTDSESSSWHEHIEVGHGSEIKNVIFTWKCLLEVWFIRNGIS